MPRFKVQHVINVEDLHYVDAEDPNEAYYLSHEMDAEDDNILRDHIDTIIELAEEKTWEPSTL